MYYNSKRCFSINDVVLYYGQLNYGNVKKSLRPICDFLWFK